jgi:RHS repeat-associated protein
MAGGSSAVANPLLFTGRRLDPETGLYYYRARYMDAVLGRFLQRDPLAYVAGMNLYQYAGGNPVIHLDPSGKWSLCDKTVGRLPWIECVLSTMLGVSSAQWSAIRNIVDVPKVIRIAQTAGWSAAAGKIKMDVERFIARFGMKKLAALIGKQAAKKLIPGIGVGLLLADLCLSLYCCKNAPNKPW